MKPITSLTMWIRNHRVTAAIEADELILLHMGTGRFFGLDPVGTVIWSLLENPCGIEQIIAAVAIQFGADPEAIRTDITDFMTSLVQSDLVEEI